MAQINLTDPVNGTIADATLIANNNALLENVINGNIDNTNLAPNAVTTDKILDGTVQTADLADGAITQAKLAPGVVTGIPPNSITSGMIQDGSITQADLAPGMKRTFSAYQTAPPAVATLGDTWWTTCQTNNLWGFMYRPDIFASFPWQFIGGAPYVVAGGVFNSSNGAVFNGSWQNSGNFANAFMAGYRGVYACWLKTTCVATDLLTVGIGIGTSGANPADDGSDTIDSVQAAGTRAFHLSGVRTYTLQTGWLAAPAYRAPGGTQYFNLTHFTVIPLYLAP